MNIQLLSEVVPFPSSDFDVVGHLQSIYAGIPYNQSDVVGLRGVLKTTYEKLKSIHDARENEVLLTGVHNQPIEEGLLFCILCEMYREVPVSDMPSLSQRRGFTCSSCVQSKLEPTYLASYVQQRNIPKPNAWMSPRKNPALFRLSDSGRDFCTSMYMQPENCFHDIASSQEELDAVNKFRRCACMQVRCVRNVAYSREKCGYCSNPMARECIPENDAAGCCRKCYLSTYPTKPEDNESRKAIRNFAVGNTLKAASKWPTSGKKDGKSAFAVGDVVTIDVDYRDRTKADPRHLPCIIVEITSPGMYRLACAAGNLGVYDSGSLKPAPNQLPSAHGLVSVAVDWTKNKEVASVKDAVRFISLLGGVTLTKCSCELK